MSFVENSPSTGKYKPYLQRYLSEVPKERQKKHNFRYPYAISQLSVFLDDERNLALLLINPIITGHGEDYPSAYAFFVENEIILLQGDEKGLFCDFKTKQAGFMYLVLPYEVPESLKGREIELRRFLTEAYICVGHRKSSQYMAYDHIEVAFDQKYSPRR